jgi:hypothetical protein
MIHLASGEYHDLAVHVDAPATLLAPAYWRQIDGAPSVKRLYVLPVFSLPLVNGYGGIVFYVDDGYLPLSQLYKSTIDALNLEWGRVFQRQRWLIASVVTVNKLHRFARKVSLPLLLGYGGFLAATAAAKSIRYSLFGGCHLAPIKRRGFAGS